MEENQRIINRDYIGFIIEENGEYQYKEINIPYPHDIIDALTDMKDDDNLSIMDVQDLFYQYYPKDKQEYKYINYLFPNNYNSSFKTSASSPILYNHKDFPYDKIDIGGIFITYYIEKYLVFTSGFSNRDEYYLSLKCRENDFFKENQSIVLLDLLDKYKHDSEMKAELEKLKKNNFVYTIQQYNNLWNEFVDAVKKKTEQDIMDLKKNLRLYFADGCIRYIHALYFENTIKELPKSTLMFSTEKLGWTSYKHQISQIEHIEVRSNFGYGSKSYSYCNLFYKEVPILPYTDAVIYTSVSWQQIVNYTRCFVPERNSCWKKTFDFVIYVSNLIKNDPQKFVDDFIVEEIHQMLELLKKILKATPEELKNQYRKQELKDRRTTFVWNTEPDQKSYNIFPEEFGDSIKIEKITGCLVFLDNMRKLNEFIPSIHLFIDELINLNNQIHPLIDKNISKLTEEIKQNKAELDDLEKTSNDIKLLLKQCLEKHAPELEYLINLNNDYRKEYLEENPQLVEGYEDYLDINENLKEKTTKLEEKTEHLRLRENFLKRFEECKERITNYIDK